jgi:hypothetical protein
MGIALLFSISFCLLSFMDHKHEALWPLKNFKLYIMCTLILINSLHLTVGSRLILTQNEI